MNEGYRYRVVVRERGPDRITSCGRWMYVTGVGAESPEQAKDYARRMCRAFPEQHYDVIITEKTTVTRTLDIDLNPLEG